MEISSWFVTNGKRQIRLQHFELRWSKIGNTKNGELSRFVSMTRMRQQLQQDSAKGSGRWISKRSM
jgi:hypothetical protein